MRVNDSDSMESFYPRQQQMSNYLQTLLAEYYPSRTVGKPISPYSTVYMAALVKPSAILSTLAIQNAQLVGGITPDLLSYAGCFLDKGKYSERFILYVSRIERCFEMKVRFVFVLLAVALVISSVSAMGHEPIEEWAAGIKEQYGGTTITVAVASHPSVEAFKQMIPRFEELTGITVVLDEMEEGQLGQRMLLEVSAESASYDAMMTAIEWSPLVASSGYATPLEPWIESDITPDWFNYEDILQAYRDMFLWEDGMHYGIPYAGETVFMFYREDLFEEHGIDVPTTYDEVLAAAQYFSENVDGVDGISYRARLGWEFTYMWSIFLAPFGGMMVDPATGDVALDSPGTVASLEYIRDLWQYGPVGGRILLLPRGVGCLHARSRRDHDRGFGRSAGSRESGQIAGRGHDWLQPAAGRACRRLFRRLGLVLRHDGRFRCQRSHLGFHCLFDERRHAERIPGKWRHRLAGVGAGRSRPASGKSLLSGDAGYAATGSRAGRARLERGTADAEVEPDQRDHGH